MGIYVLILMFDLGYGPRTNVIMHEFSSLTACEAAKTYIIKTNKLWNGSAECLPK